MKPESDKETTFDNAIDGVEAADSNGADVAESDGAAPASLEEQLAEATRRADENYDLYLRERAELDNFRKRSARDRIEASRFAIEPLARDLLPVVDNLERAVAHAIATGEAPAVIEGVEMVLGSAGEMLERHGVHRINAVGKMFDPSLHEALAQVESDEVEANHVVEQFLPGYKLHDRLLRAAQVSVSTGPATGENEKS